MNDPATRLLHVDAFRGGIGRQEQTNRSSGVLELGLDCLELVRVHAAVEQSERVLVEPFLKQTLLQVEQCLLVLGEHDQPLVVPQLASHKEVLLDPADQGLGLGVRLLGQGRQLGGVFDVLAVVAQGFQSVIDPPLQVLGRLAPTAEVGSGVACGVFFEHRSLVVALGLLLGPFRRHASHVEQVGSVLLGFTLQMPPPGPGKGEWAGQESLGQQRVDELAQPPF